MLKQGEMYRLKEKIEYDFDSGKWKVPPFVVKAKEVNFPKIKNAIGLVKEELDQRDIVMVDTGEIVSTNASVTKKSSNNLFKRKNRSNNGAFEGAFDSQS